MILSLFLLFLMILIISFSIFYLFCFFLPALKLKYEWISDTLASEIKFSDDSLAFGGESKHSDENSERISSSEALSAENSASSSQESSENSSEISSDSHKKDFKFWSACYKLLFGGIQDS